MIDLTDIFFGQSDCCGSNVYADMDICSECGEHCEVIHEQEE